MLSLAIDKNNYKPWSQVLGLPKDLDPSKSFGKSPDPQEIEISPSASNPCPILNVSIFDKIVDSYQMVLREADKMEHDTVEAVCDKLADMIDILPVVATMVDKTVDSVLDVLV